MMASRILVASSNRIMTNANMVTRAKSTVTAPLPRAKAGLLNPLASETSFDEFLWIQLSTW